MDPDVFFRLNDLGATEAQMQMVLQGSVPVDELIRHLENPPQPEMPPALPAPEPLPPVEADPPPSMALPPPELDQPPPQLVREEEYLPYPVEIDDEPVLTGPVIPAWTLPPEEPEVVAKPLTEGDSTMANYGPPGWIWDGFKWIVGKGGDLLASGVRSTASNFVDMGPTREQLGAPPVGYRGRTRRRRRRLLTCSDKADIAYLVGQLGQGQLGKAAISALLSKRCG